VRLGHPAASPENALLADLFFMKIRPLVQLFDVEYYLPDQRPQTAKVTLAG